MFKFNITTELTVRMCIITLIYAIISYALIQKSMAIPNQLVIIIPSLFVTFGVVILINTLYCIRRYHAGNAGR